jgi:hypothetical protein
MDEDRAPCPSLRLVLQTCLDLIDRIHRPGRHGTLTNKNDENDYTNEDAHVDDYALHSRPLGLSVLQILPHILA